MPFRLSAALSLLLLARGALGRSMFLNPGACPDAFFAENTTDAGGAARPEEPQHKEVNPGYALQNNLTTRGIDFWGFNQNASWDALSAGDSVPGQYIIKLKGEANGEFWVRHNPWCG